MRKPVFKFYLYSVILAEAVGGLSALLSRSGRIRYLATAVQPRFSPPAIVFPIVWGILYALMGISAAMVYLSPNSSFRRKGLNLYVVQLIFNFFWSLIFFNAMAFLPALIWLMLLWGIVLWMISQFREVNLLAAALQIPYLLWLTFAGYLNDCVWLLNP